MRNGGLRSGASRACSCESVSCGLVCGVYGLIPFPFLVLCCAVGLRCVSVSFQGCGASGFPSGGSLPRMLCGTGLYDGGYCSVYVYISAWMLCRQAIMRCQHGAHMGSMSIPSRTESFVSLALA